MPILCTNIADEELEMISMATTRAEETKDVRDWCPPSLVRLMIEEIRLLKSAISSDHAAGCTYNVNGISVESDFCNCDVKSRHLILRNDRRLGKT